MMGMYPLQLAFPDAIYLVDAIEGGETLIKACKPALESVNITKVIHDCKRDSEVSNGYICLSTSDHFIDAIILDIFGLIIILQALYFQFGIKLHNVVDTQVRDLFFLVQKWVSVSCLLFFSFSNDCVFPYF